MWGTVQGATCSKILKIMLDVLVIEVYQVRALTLTFEQNTKPTVKILFGARSI